MQIMSILLLTFLQFIAGFGLLCLLKIYQRPAFTISISVLLGIGVFSLVPFFLQLVRVPLSAANIFSAITICCVLFNLNSKNGLHFFLNTVRSSRFRVSFYELPALLLIAF